MEKTVALVLGCDLLDGGTALGPRTVGRLVTALQLHNAVHAEIVVAPPKCPRFPAMQVTMAELMAEWLNANGCRDVVVLESRSFDTYGELMAFGNWLSMRGAVSVAIVSAPFHLRRVRRMISHLPGRPFAGRQITFIPVYREQQTAREKWILEPLKHIALVLPQETRLRMKKWFAALFGNPSW